jgi:hypothetical protein
MKKRWLAVAALVFVAGLAAGCSGDEDNPFEGSWLSLTRGSITFDGSTWVDSDGDSGEYDYTDSGEDPICGCYLDTVCNCYIVVFTTAGGSTIQERATFIDENTLELCTLLPNNSTNVCDTLVIDRPTLH